MAAAWSRIGGWLSVGAELSQGRASLPGYGEQPKVFWVPREVLPCSAMLPRPGGLQLVIGVGKGNIIKQVGLGKETVCISWVPLSRESRAWAELD